MNDLIKSDLYRYYGKTNFLTFLKCFILFPQFRFSVYLRKVSLCKRYSFEGLFYKIFHRKYFKKYGFQITQGTNIGKGFYICHIGGIVINRDAIIGDNCNIHPFVTIGQTNRGKLKGSPVLGNKVWIGTGSVIVGKIYIGDNVLIAPNAYINFDVPSNSIVIGNPGKIIFRENATADYINNTYPL